MSHVFFSKAYRNALTIPNKIYVKSYDDDDPQRLGVAAIEGYDSLPAEVKKVHYIQMKLESNDQADDLAEALIAKAEMWCKRGAAEVPLNVGAEVFDYVKVTDSRQGDTRTGNLGYVHRRFGKDKWTMTFGFGNWLDQLKYNAILKELETYTDAGQYFNRLSVKNLYAENIVAENCDFVWLDPDNTIDLSKIGDTLDNLPDGEVYARVKSLHLDAGQVKLDEHIWYKPGYDPTTKFDLGTDDLDDIPDGTLYRRAKSAALTADGLVILDQVVVGTYGLVKSTDISAGHILLSTVVQSSSYQTVTSSQKSYWNDKPENMDEIGEGTIYQRVKTTEIDSGRIKLTTANYYSTKFSGKWYLDGSSAAGVSIEAGVGINIWGRNQALTTRATETGTVQCSVNSSGQITAGAGNVLLDANGITVKGEWLKFYYGATLRGSLYGGSSNFVVQAVGNLQLVAGTDIKIDATGKVDMSISDYLVLPRVSANPGAMPHGTMVLNSATGYVNCYDTVYGGWWHFDRTGGWA